MRKVWIAAVVMAFGWLALSALTQAEDEKPKHTTKEVMKLAHKGGLLKKVVDGKATDEEKKQLVELYTSLAGNKPKKGDAAAWKEKTDAVVAAAKAAAEGKEGAGALLTKATNCMGCHSAHK